MMSDKKDSEIMDNDRSASDEPTEEDAIFENETSTHESHHKNGKKNLGKKKSGAGPWQILTVLFAALFVLAVFTNTFQFARPGQAGGVSSEDGALLKIEQDIKAAKAKTDPAVLKPFEQELSDLKKEVQTNNVDISKKAKELQSRLSKAVSTGKPSNSSVTVVGEPAVLDFYVMSQCPYGVQVEDGVYPVLKSLGDNVDFNLYFIANDNGDGTFRSLHGEPEVLGNIIQTCAIKYEPDSYMDLVSCMNKDTQTIPGNWEECAKGLSMDVDTLKTCYENEEGKELLRENIAKAQEVGATGSPTMYLNGELYQGGRTENDFMRALCDALSYAPEPCKDLPEPTVVNIITLNDERCAECDISGLMSQLKSIFPGMKVTSFDYADKEGKELYDKTEITYLPAIFFDESVEGAEGYASVQSYLLESGEYKSLRIGASFDPKAEICDNKVDDNADKLVDCKDPTCKDTVLCREEIENQLQVFIMSDCPYGREAVKALHGVIENFGDSLDYEIHYIANEADEGFASLHGQYEVDEDIIQLCVKEHSPSVWFDYVYCRSVNGVKGKDWKTCAEDEGVDTAAVQKCFDGDEGSDLLREDIKIANNLQIGASPTWLANNKYTFSGIDSETVKNQFCARNPDLKGCENTLSDDTGGIAPGSC